MASKQWKPAKEEIGSIEELAYKGYHTPEEFVAMLGCSLEEFDAALDADVENFEILNAYMRGWSRARSDLQAKQMAIAMGEYDASAGEIQMINYILQTKYAHDPTHAVTKVKKELKEKELGLKKATDLRSHALAQSSYNLAEKRFEFTKSDTLLRLAERANLSKEELEELVGVLDK